MCIRDRHDRAVFFDDRYEPVGRDETKGRMMPSQQRLEAGYSSRYEVNDRLVDEPELITGERVGKLALEAASLGRGLSHLRLVGDAVAAAGGLGPVDGDVG